MTVTKKVNKSPVEMCSCGKRPVEFIADAQDESDVFRCCARCRETMPQKGTFMWTLLAKAATA